MPANPDRLPPAPAGYLWLSRIVTRGLRHIGNVDVRMRTILEVKGSNETGKSLFISQVRGAFKKEHDPRLIADGYDEYSVTIELVDEQSVEYYIRTTTSDKKTERQVGASDGRVIEGQIETWLNKLTDAFLMDPLTMLDASRKVREEFLRKVLPVRFKGEEITAITGKPAQDCDMSVFDGILAGAEANRSTLNAEEESIKGAIKRLASGLMLKPKHPLSPEPEEEIDQTDYAAEEAARRKELKDLETWARDGKSQIQIFLRTEVDDLQSELQQKIDDLRKEYDAKIAEANSAAQAAIAQSDEKWAPQIAAKNKEVGEAHAKADLQQQQLGVRKQLDAERIALKNAARAATVAQELVDRLRNLQSAKWNSLPIKGVTYNNGDLFFEGKNINKKEVNQAKVYHILAEVLTHSVKPGMLPLIITERTESLDDESREMFYNAMRSAGFQVIAEDVSRKKLPFTLETID